MTLLDIARRNPTLPDPAVPDWTMGCFRRRSITFYSGETDTETRVFWLQSGRLCADFRFGLPGHVEAGVAHATWDGSRMRWSDWTALADRDKWPEAGELRRVGNSLIEFAPSGAYVEDWRLQPHEPGLLAGLRLVDETDRETGTILHRGGGLLVCSDHVAVVRGGPTFAAAYAAAGRTILQYGEGDTGWSLDGFALSPEGLTQDLMIHGRATRRRYTIDTLIADYSFPLVTAVSEAGSRWLGQESATLLSVARTEI